MLTFTDRFVPRAKPGASSSSSLFPSPERAAGRLSAERLSRSSRCLSCSCAQSRDCSLGARCWSSRAAAKQAAVRAASSGQGPARGGAGRAMPTAPLRRRVHCARRAALAGAVPHISSQPGLAASGWNLGNPSPPGCCPSLECSGRSDRQRWKGWELFGRREAPQARQPPPQHALAAMLCARLLRHRGSSRSGRRSAHRALECQCWRWTTKVKWERLEGGGTAWAWLPCECGRCEKHAAPLTPPGRAALRLPSGSYAAVTLNGSLITSVVIQSIPFKVPLLFQLLKLVRRASGRVTCVLLCHVCAFLGLTGRTLHSCDMGPAAWLRAAAAQDGGTNSCVESRPSIAEQFLCCARARNSVYLV